MLVQQLPPPARKCPRRASALRSRGLSVWKVVVQPLGKSEACFRLPAPAEILGADWEESATPGELGHVALFVRVAPDAPYCERRLLIAQTSMEGLPRARYVATVRNTAGCAFHLFEADAPEPAALDLAA